MACHTESTESRLYALLNDSNVDNAHKDQATESRATPCCGNTNGVTHHLPPAVSSDTMGECPDDTLPARRRTRSIVIRAVLASSLRPKPKARRSTR